MGAQQAETAASEWDTHQGMFAEYPRFSENHTNYRQKQSLASFPGLSRPPGARCCSSPAVPRVQHIWNHAVRGSFLRHKCTDSYDHRRVKCWTNSSLATPPPYPALQLQSHIVFAVVFPFPESHPSGASGSGPLGSASCTQQCVLGHAVTLRTFLILE